MERMGQIEPMNTKRFFLMAVLAAGVVMSGMAANYPINNGVLQSALNANSQGITNAGTVSAANVTAQSITLGGTVVTNWNQVGGTNAGGGTNILSGTATNLDAGATNQAKALALQVAVPITTYNAAWGALATNIFSGYLATVYYNQGWGALPTNVLSQYLPSATYNTAWGNLPTNIFSGYLATAAYNGAWGSLSTNIFSLYLPAATYNTAWGNLPTNIFSGYLATALYNTGWGALSTNLLTGLATSSYVNAAVAANTNLASLTVTNATKLDNGAIHTDGNGMLTLGGGSTVFSPDGSWGLGGVTGQPDGSFGQTQGGVFSVDSAGNITGKSLIINSSANPSYPVGIDIADVNPVNGDWTLNSDANGNLQFWRIATIGNTNDGIKGTINQVGVVNFPRYNGSGAGLTNIPYAALTGVPSIPSTNGLATTNYVNAITNGLATTSYVNGITNGLATTSYVNASTNGLVGPSITNGLGSAAYTATSAYDAAGAAIATTNTPSLVRTNSTGVNLFGSFTGNGGGLTNLTGTLNPLAAAYLNTNSVVDPQVQQHLNAYWNWLTYSGMATNLVDAIPFAQRFNGTNTLKTLRGNSYIWNAATYDKFGWGGVFNATSTVSYTLPVGLTNVIVIETWRTDAGSSVNNAGALFHLLDTNTLSGAYLHMACLNTYGIGENNGTLYSPVGYKNSYWVPTDISLGNLGAGVFAWRIEEAKTVAIARSAVGQYQIFQDGIPMWGPYDNTFGGQPTNTFVLSNICPTPFNRIDIGLDVTNPLFNVSGDLNIGSPKTNFYVASIQIVSFQTTNQIPGLVQFFTGAAAYLNIPGWSRNYYAGDSTVASMGRGDNGSGAAATNNWPWWKESWVNNFNYINEAVQAQTWSAFSQWALVGGLNEVSNMPPGFKLNYFLSFNNDLSATLASTVYLRASNGLAAIKGIRADVNTVVRDCMMRWTNANASSWTLLQTTNTLAFEGLMETNSPVWGTIPLVNHYVKIDPYLTQYMYNTNPPPTGAGASINGYHLGQDSTNSILTQWQAHYLSDWEDGVVNPSAWPMAIPYSPQFNGSNCFYDIPTYQATAGGQLPVQGNGSGLTNLNAATLTGTVPQGSLPGAVVTNNAAGLTLAGTFTGNGAGITNLPVILAGGIYPDGKRLGFVATRARYNEATNIVNRVVNATTMHVARDSIGYIKVAYQNFLTNEISLYGSSMFAGAIEYPAGTIQPLTFAGQAITNGAGGTMVYSDLATLATNIPEGATFWVHSYQSNSVGCIYTAYCNPSYDKCEFSTGNTNKTMQTGVGSGSTLGYFPAAIIGYTAKPSVLGLGDSRCFGKGDSVDASGSLGDARMWDPNYGFVNMSVPGDTFANFTNHDTARLSLTNYATVAYVPYAINDMANGIITNYVCMISQIGLPIYAATLEPRSTTTDSFVDLAGQTVTANEFWRTNFNYALRAGQIRGVRGFIEKAAVVESGGTNNTGLWIANGTANYYTTDGLHGNYPAYLLWAQSIPDPLYNGTRNFLPLTGGQINGALTVNGPLNAPNLNLTNLSSSVIMNTNQLLLITNALNQVMVAGWVGGVPTIGVQGTNDVTALQFGIASGGTSGGSITAGRMFSVNLNSPFLTFMAGTGANNGVGCIQWGDINSTTSTGTFVDEQISPYYSQSGSAAGVDLLINRTNVTVGTGVQYHIQAGTTTNNIYANNFIVDAGGDTWISTNSTCPAPLPGGDWLWNSNHVLFWCTATTTNKIAGP